MVLKSVGAGVGPYSKAVEGNWDLFIHLDSFHFKFL